MPRISRMRGHRRGSSQNIADLVPSLPTASQASCPLFTLLPAEIRNRIYAFSLESEDFAMDGSPQILYKQNAFYYRPGYKRPKRIQTGLLQTCQQIYDEASLLPPGINEHTFWFYRAPPHVRNASSPLDYFLKMTPKQRGQVDHLHLFTQQFFLEDNHWSDIWSGIQMGTEGRTLRGACRIAPRKLTITFRHTDWWFWENNDPLGIDPFRPGRTRAGEEGKPVSYRFHNRSPWGEQFCKIPSLEELVIEFETIMRKKDQLDAIIERALKWKFPMDTDESLYLVAEPQSLSAYTWIGAKEKDLKQQGSTASRPVNGDQFSQETEQAPSAPTLEPYHPRKKLKLMDGDGSSLEKETEEFYVVFLTWKRKRIERSSRQNSEDIDRSI
ncbi:hypothetical protein VI817_006375 [Penicillium citrinum]|nr:hypothetical protein VI817_006375 [Penicillium citrinum]